MPFFSLKLHVPVQRTFKDLGIDNNISMRTVRRYLHNCKDDFSRMRVQKFSTAGQQIAMTKTSISVTFDNLAKLDIL